MTKALIFVKAYFIFFLISAIPVTAFVIYNFVTTRVMFENVPNGHLMAALIIGQVAGFCILSRLHGKKAVRYCAGVAIVSFLIAFIGQAQRGDYASLAMTALHLFLSALTGFLLSRAYDFLRKKRFHSQGE